MRQVDELLEILSGGQTDASQACGTRCLSLLGEQRFREGTSEARMAGCRLATREGSVP